LLWDGLPAHRSRAMRDWLNTQRRWLVVERLPAYAPELNPVEGLWSWLKGTQLASLISPTLREVVEQAELGIERARRTPQLAYSFLRGLGSRSHDTSDQHPQPVTRYLPAFVLSSPEGSGQVRLGALLVSAAGGQSKWNGQRNDRHLRRRPRPAGRRRFRGAATGLIMSPNSAPT